MLSRTGARRRDRGRRWALTRAALVIVLTLLTAGPVARGAGLARAGNACVGGTAPYLHTCVAYGAHIVDANGAPVRLRSLNWYGFDSNDFVPGGLHYWSYKTIIRRIVDAGYNTLRIPFSNELVERDPVVSSLARVCVGTTCISAPGADSAAPVTGAYLLQAADDGGASNADLVGKDALGILKTVVDYAGSQGLHVILDDHRSEAGWGPEENGLWYTAPSCSSNTVPYTCYDPQSWLDDWRKVGALFAGDPAVIGMDLRNEPHSAHAPSTCADYVAGAHWGPCGGPNGINNTATDWRQAAATAGNALLGIDANWLVFVEGVSTYPNGGGFPRDGYAENLQGVADYPVVLDTANRVVYSPHDYRFFQTQNFGRDDSAANMRSTWTRDFGFVEEPGHSYTAPLWVGEFGTCTSLNSCVVNAQNDGSGVQPNGGWWLRNFVDYLDNGDPAAGVPGGISWSYWPVNGTYSDSWVHNSASWGQYCYGNREGYGILGGDWATLSNPYLQQVLFASATGTPTGTGPSRTATPTGTPPPPSGPWTGRACAAYTLTPTPSATSTPTNTPTNTPTATATNTPTNTPTNTATATPTNTPIPPTATRTPVPPTATPRPTPPSLTVVVGRNVASGGILTVRVHTIPGAPVTVRLQVTGRRTSYTGAGKSWRRVARTVVLYGVTRQGTADGHGNYAASVRVTYRTATPVALNVLVTARISSRLVLSRAAGLTLLPPVSPLVGAARADSGVSFLVQIPRATPFLGELLPVTTTLTNEGRTTIYDAEPGTGTSCGGGWAATRGGTRPFYPLPRLTSPHCPLPRVRPLAPGQRVTALIELPLTASGAVTVTGQAYVYRAARRVGSSYIPIGRPLFARGLPALILRVTARAPAGRLLSIRRVGGRVLIGVDRGRAPSSLFVEQEVAAGDTRWTLGLWRPVAGRAFGAISDGGSGGLGRHTTWTVLVGAPGYRIASAVYRL